MFPVALYFWALWGGVKWTQYACLWALKIYIFTQSPMSQAKKGGGVNFTYSLIKFKHLQTSLKNNFRWHLYEENVFFLQNFTMSLLIYIYIYYNNGVLILKLFLKNSLVASSVLNITVARSQTMTKLNYNCFFTNPGFCKTVPNSLSNTCIHLAGLQTKNWSFTPRN